MSHQINANLEILFWNAGKLEEKKMLLKDNITKIK